MKDESWDENAEYEEKEYDEGNPRMARGFGNTFLSDLKLVIFCEWSVTRNRVSSESKSVLSKPQRWRNESGSSDLEISSICYILCLKLTCNSVFRAYFE